MNEKINVLDVNIDSCTAKEAMKETIAFLESEPVSVIDVVSVDGLMQMNDLSELKARMNEFDLVLPGEKLILEAAEEARLPKEIDIKLYLKMFMRYLHKNHKRMSSGRIGGRWTGSISLYAENLQWDSAGRSCKSISGGKGRRHVGQCD